MSTTGLTAFRKRLDLSLHGLISLRLEWRY